MEQDKLGFYLGVARTVQKLKQVSRNTPIDAEGDDGLLNMLWHLENLLKESTNGSGRAGLRPFLRLRALHQDILDFCRQLEANLDDESSAEAVKLGRIRQRQMQNLIQRFEQVFQEEVEDRIIFISPTRSGLLDFSSLDSFLHETADKQYFQYLPRLAQRNFEDAGKCIAYGLPGAAIALSLQAVEATIRFYYIRHGGENKLDRRGGYLDELPDWGHMINWHRNIQPSFLPGDEVGQRYCHAMLDRLRHRYRNAIAHGRAYFETGRPDASINEAETVFRECWTAVRLLAAETPRRIQLNCRIKIANRPNFDTAVASFLYAWNPELPPFGIKHVEFDSSVSPTELIDDTVQDTNFWPHRVQAQANESLSRRILGCFRMQPNYAATIDPIIEYVDQYTQGTVTSRFNRENPREDDVGILDLFVGIRRHVQNDPQQILTETWKMLDKFVNSSLRPDGPSLVTDLNMRPVFNTLCTLEMLSSAMPASV